MGFNQITINKEMKKIKDYNFNFKFIFFSCIVIFIVFCSTITSKASENVEFKPPNLKNSDQLIQLKKDNPAYIIYYKKSSKEFVFMGKDKFSMTGDTYMADNFEWTSKDYGATWTMGSFGLSTVNLLDTNNVVVQASETLYLNNGEEFFYINPITTALMELSDKTVLQMKTIATVGCLALSLMLLVPLCKKLWIFF